MVNQQVLEGNWNQIKGKIREKWGQLTDDDLSQAGGQIDRLAGIIQRKTGEGRDAVERFLSDVTGEASSTISAAAEKARRFASHAAESFGEAGRQTADQIQAGYEEAKRLVSERPAVSLGVCFGAGVLAGMLLVMAMRER